MKCHSCAEKAVFQMRQHKLALCGAHYLEWLPAQVDRFIYKYKMFDPGHRVLVAVSGGKDSLSLWEILIRLGYRADGLYIGLGIDEGIGYSDESLRMCRQFADERGLHLNVVDVGQEYGETIPQMAARTRRGKDRPCAVCGMSKRHIMNRVALEGGYDVLATGHNLDDEAATLLGNTLNWQGNYIVRQGPVLEADLPGLVRKVKPLCRIYEREMAAYAMLRGIDYIYGECPFAAGAKSIYYKEMLNKMEFDTPGAKLNFYVSFLQAKQNGLFAQPALPANQEIHRCPTCGQPTQASGNCSFCKLTSFIKE